MMKEKDKTLMGHNYDIISYFCEHNGHNVGQGVQYYIQIKPVKRFLFCEVKGKHYNFILYLYDKNHFGQLKRSSRTYLFLFAHSKYIDELNILVLSMFHITYRSRPLLPESGSRNLQKGVRIRNL